MKIIGKVNLSLCLQTFLTAALDQGEWSASSLGLFNYHTHKIGQWVDPRAGLTPTEGTWISLRLHSLNVKQRF